MKNIKESKEKYLKLLLELIEVERGLWADNYMTKQWETEDWRKHCNKSYNEMDRIQEELDSIKKKHNREDQEYLDGLEYGIRMKEYKEYRKGLKEGLDYSK